MVSAICLMKALLGSSSVLEEGRLVGIKRPSFAPF